MTTNTNPLREALTRFDQREDWLAYWQKGSGHRERLRKDPLTPLDNVPHDHESGSCTACLRDGYRRALHVTDTGPDVERLAEAMNESFWPDDLPFVDDGEAFWRPFAAKVLVRLRESKP